MTSKPTKNVNANLFAKIFFSFILAVATRLLNAQAINPPQTFREILVDQYGQDDSRAQEALIKRIVAIEVSPANTNTKVVFFRLLLKTLDTHVNFFFRVTKWR